MNFKEFEQRTDRMNEQEIADLLAGLCVEEGDALILDFVNSAKDFHKKDDAYMEQFKHLLPDKK